MIFDFFSELNRCKIPLTPNHQPTTINHQPPTINH
jgi:hypothetical protein